MQLSSISEQAARFARSAYLNSGSSEIIAVAKRALIDFFGVTLAGSREPVSRIAQDHVRRSRQQSGSCTIVGTGLQTTPEFASWANAIAGHALDFDDVSWSTIAHPTVTIMPAALAAAQEGHVSGRQVLLAYCIGVEIANKIGRLAMPEVSERGWHTTSVFGPLGAAIASGLLFGLNFEELVWAIGIGATTASGLRVNFGSMAKQYHAGQGARHGVEASILAKGGMTASSNVFEGADGFLQLFSGKSLPRSQMQFGEPWDILSPGLVFKKYPCCSGSHPAIDCILEMKKRWGMTTENVGQIKVGVSLLGPKELVCHNPATASEAKFSMEYALAAAVRWGRIGLEEFQDKNIVDPKVSSLMKRVVMDVDPEFAALGFIGSAPAKIRVTLKNGRILESRCDFARGNPEKPLKDQEIENKFFECAGSVLGYDQSSRLLDTLWSYDQLTEMKSNVFSYLQVQGRV